MINFLFFIFINLQAAVTIEDIPQSYDEWDSYPLVEVLIRDGQLDLAEKQLNGLFDPIKNAYYFAMIDLKKNRFREAITKLKSLSQVPHKDLAQAYAALNQTQACVDSFNKAGDLNSIENRLYALCAENIKNYGLTFILLSRYSDEKTVLQKISFLKKLNLFDEARKVALSFIQSKPPLHQSISLLSYFINDLVVLEALKLSYPNSVEILSLWSHHQYKNGFIKLAASGYEKAAWLGEKDSFLASAELWRSIGYYRKSEQMSSFISDYDKKLRLNLSLALDEENYAKIIGLSGAYSRSRLIHDQDLLYVFYYSFHQMHEVDKANYYKTQISRSDLLDKINRMK